MRKLILIAVLLGASSPAWSNVISVVVAFDASQGDVYQPTSLLTGQRYLRINRTLSEPLSINQGDTLEVTFSGLNNFRFDERALGEFENAFITWSNYQNPFPVFSATFHNLTFSGNILKDFFPSSDYRPNYYSGGCPYASFDLCRTNSFYKTGGLTDYNGANLDVARVDFLLVSSIASLNIQNVSFEISSISAVPEPSTWAMLLIGFAGIGYAAYHRRLRANVIPKAQ